jgi:UPF0716 protein FxsA
VRLIGFVALFVALAFAELWVTVIKVPEAIGAGPTIALIVASSLLGTWLLKHQGRLVWRRFGAALAERRAPTREVADGALVIFGGALLIVPGFVTDVIGLFLLVPATRPFARRLLLRWATRRVPGRRRGERPRMRDADVEGTAYEYYGEPADGAGRPARQLRG